MSRKQVFAVAVAVLALALASARGAAAQSNSTTPPQSPGTCSTATAPAQAEREYDTAMAQALAAAKALSAATSQQAATGQTTPTGQSVSPENLQKNFQDAADAAVKAWDHWQACRYEWEFLPAPGGPAKEEPGEMAYALFFVAFYGLGIGPDTGGMATVDPPRIDLDEGPPMYPEHSVVNVGDLAPLDMNCKNDTGCEFTPPSPASTVTITTGEGSTGVEIPVNPTPTPQQKPAPTEQPAEQSSKAPTAPPGAARVDVSYRITGDWRLGGFLTYKFTPEPQPPSNLVPRSLTLSVPFVAGPAPTYTHTMTRWDGSKISFTLGRIVDPKLVAQTALYTLLARSAAGIPRPFGSTFDLGDVWTLRGGFFDDAYFTSVATGHLYVAESGQNMAMSGALVPAGPATSPEPTGPRHPAAKRDLSLRDAAARFELASFPTGNAPPAESPSQAAGQAAANAGRQIFYSFIPNGNASGNTFKLRVVDPTGKLQKVRARDGLILQPLKPVAAAPVEAGPGGKELVYEVTAFCVDYAKLPPDPNQLYRVAPPYVQAHYGNIGPVIRAGRELAEAGKFHRNDPAYKVLAQQYALWAQLGHWNQQQFTEVFLEKTKTDAEKENVKWTKQLEQSLMGIVPGMWGDIQMIQDAAAKLSGGQPAERPGPAQ
jgi:hypothetical protein